MRVFFKTFDSENPASLHVLRSTKNGGNERKCWETKEVIFVSIVYWNKVYFQQGFLPGIRFFHLCIELVHLYAPWTSLQIFGNAGNKEGDLVVDPLTSALSRNNQVAYNHLNNWYRYRLLLRLTYITLIRIRLLWASLSINVINKKVRKKSVALAIFRLLNFVSSLMKYLLPT